MVVYIVDQWHLELGALDGPRDADQLAGGNVLVNDSMNGRIREITSSGAVVWERAVPSGSYDADRLTGGNTLMSCPRRIVEVDASCVFCEITKPSAA